MMAGGKPPLSDEQRKKIEANKQKAMLTLAKKKAGKTPSKGQANLFSFFTPTAAKKDNTQQSNSANKDSSFKTEAKDITPARDGDDAQKKKLFFQTPSATKKPKIAKTETTHKLSPTTTTEAKPTPTTTTTTVKPTVTAKPTPKRKSVIVDDDDDDVDDDEQAEEQTKQQTIQQTKHQTTQPQLNNKVKKEDEEATSGERRRRNRVATYAESEDSDEDEAIKLGKSQQAKKGHKRLKRAIQESSDEEEYIPNKEDRVMAKEDAELDANDDDDDDDDDMDIDACLACLEGDPRSTDDEPIPNKQRKKTKIVPKKEVNKTPSKQSSTLSSFAAGSTPNKRSPTTPSSTLKRTSASTSTPKTATKTQTQEEEDRYPWLVNPKDKNKILHSDPTSDKSTLFVPLNPHRVIKGIRKPLSDFETQYWNVKKNWYNTMLFFKKGKFFELYGKDAYIANNELGLKLTDRVNMPMAGVPEKTFTMWATKLLGLGYNVARADELESALAKGMREKKEKKGSTSKQSKIIQRELTTVLTQGTLSGDFLATDNANFVMSIQEGENNKFGVVFCDVGTNEINMTEFEDDLALTQFETLLVQVKPREFILSKGKLSAAAKRMIRNHSAGMAMNYLEPEKEFWSGEKTRDNIDREGYFKQNDNIYPGDLGDFKDNEEAMSALGGLIFYFKKLLIDEKVFSQGRFLQYSPLRHGGTLLLDGQTLQNLEVLENVNDGGTKGTLFELLCHCRSAFGKRKFRKWLCHPLKDEIDINARYDAVDELESNDELRSSLEDLLRQVPDLERINTQIVGGSCKLSNFVNILEAYVQISSTIGDLQNMAKDLNSPRLRTLLIVGNTFPDIEETIQPFKNAFDWDVALESGMVFPKKGAVAEYDEVVNTITEIEEKLDSYIKKYRKAFGVRCEFYHPGVAKEPYQVPLPAKTKVPNDWLVKSQTGKEKRYWSPEIRCEIDPLKEAQETQRQIQVQTFKHLQQTFDETMPLWTAVVSNLAEIDCLLSLLRAKHEIGSPTCRPTFITGPPTLKFESMRHPCLTSGASETVSDFISNDTKLGGDSPIACVLTGPNMGGKSTLLRQTCIGVLMAQLGAYIPAESVTLTPTDRIFTRIGANDNIIAGRSTFMVELKETATILNMATSKSLVILDELGRGTSTFDGTAIAHATLTHLVDTIGCRSLFATHYHSLTDDFKEHPRVSLQHMACQVHDSSRDVTFLYQLTPGVCSKSYGLNVAGMAGVPIEIIDTAEATAAKFEAASRPGFGNGGKNSNLKNVLHQINTRGEMGAAELENVCKMMEGP